MLAALMGSSLTLVPPAGRSPPVRKLFPLKKTRRSQVQSRRRGRRCRLKGPVRRLGPSLKMTPALEVLEQASAGTDWPDSEADILSADSVMDDLEPEHAGGRAGAGGHHGAGDGTGAGSGSRDLQRWRNLSRRLPPDRCSGSPRSDRGYPRADPAGTGALLRRAGQQEVDSEPEPAPEPGAEGERPRPRPGDASGTDGVPRTADGSFDQEGMRRRIEETRNRLKAKAFDAMMSGEASMLSRDSGSGPRASAASPLAPLDSEVAESIEKTLTEEEF